MPRCKAGDIDLQIGLNIFRLRAAKKLSRAGLGAGLTPPVSPQAFIKYEDGRTRVPAAALVELARLLGVTLADLFDGVEDLLPKNLPALLEQQTAVSNLTEALIIDVARGFRP